MKDLRNIVIGVLSVSLVWGWASAQNRRNPPAVPVGAIGTFTAFEADVNIVGGQGQRGGNMGKSAFRMNTATGQIEMLSIVVDQGRYLVTPVPVTEER